MELKVYAILDVKASNYGQPFFMAQNGLALRAFSDLVDDVKSTVNKHPEDYKLYELAVYDDCAGTFTTLPKPNFLANATDFVSK